VIETSTGILLGTYDNIVGINAALNIVYNAVGNGTQLSFSLASTPKDENTTNVYINGVYQQKNTYALAGSTIVFSAAPPFISNIEITYF
jgi:hypothetical protein